MAGWQFVTQFVTMKVSLWQLLIPLNNLKKVCQQQTSGMGINIF